MSLLIISTKAELLKIKRTSSIWLTLIVAAFIPALLLFGLFTETENVISMAGDPWLNFFNLGWRILSGYFLAIYIILLSTLIPQLEYRNNTWKQVFASPQSIGLIFFSKFFAVHLMILFCFLIFNLLLIIAATIGNSLIPELAFFNNSIDGGWLTRVNVKMYISILGISAIQYWLSLRFTNFIAPVGFGLALVIGSSVALNFEWEHIDKFPYAYTFLTFDAIQKPGRPFIENHELTSIGYFILFIILGIVDLKTRKGKS